MRPNNNIGYLLNHLSFVLSRHSDQVLQEQLGIGFSQFKIMMVLRWNPSIQQKKIAQQLGQTEASISRQIKLLHDKMMLNTRINPANKRVHMTTLTTKGEKLTEQAMLVLNNYHAPTFDALNSKQQQQLLEILTIMHEHVCSGETSTGFHHP
ncbi:MAG TPA: MarR family winged helix-turn-helix transcriptional regulator [Candidatus Saccharimonadales bacterium]|nr:MarR family winged helix-turn-helix transcriptional regulator [Candidatus Saccharimonadales bacterium]